MKNVLWLLLLSVTTTLACADSTASSDNSTTEATSKEWVGRWYCERDDTMIDFGHEGQMEGRTRGDNIFGQYIVEGAFLTLFIDNPRQTLKFLIVSKTDQAFRARSLDTGKTYTYVYKGTTQTERTLNTRSANSWTGRWYDSKNKQIFEFLKEGSWIAQKGEETNFGAYTLEGDNIFLSSLGSNEGVNFKILKKTSSTFTTLHVASGDQYNFKYVSAPTTSHERIISLMQAFHQQRMAAMSMTNKAMTNTIQNIEQSAIYTLNLNAQQQRSVALINEKAALDLAGIPYRIVYSNGN